MHILLYIYHELVNKSSFVFTLKKYLNLISLKIKIYKQFEIKVQKM